MREPGDVACSAGSSPPTTTKPRSCSNATDAHDHRDEPVPVRVGPPDGRADPPRRELRRPRRRRDARARARAGARGAGDPRAPTGPTASTSAPTSGAPPARACPDHLHVHVLPRWTGDTNFMTSVAEARVLPERLHDGYDKLRAHWPDPVASPVADGGDRPHRCRRRTRRRRAARGPRRHRVRRAVHVPRHQAPPDRRDDLRGARGRVLAAGLATGNGGFVLAAVLLGLHRGLPLRRGLAAADRPDRSARASPAAPSVSRSGTRPRSSRGGGCAAGRRGASSSTAPTNRRASADSCSSTRSTAASSASTPSTTPKTGRSLPAPEVGARA